MSHRVIIDTTTPIYTTTPEGRTDLNASAAEYSFTFTPSHHMSEQQQTKRITRIRRVLEKLATDVTSSDELTE